MTFNHQKSSNKFCGIFIYKLFWLHIRDGKSCLNRNLWITFPEGVLYKKNRSRAMKTSFVLSCTMLCHIHTHAWTCRDYRFSISLMKCFHNFTHIHFLFLQCVGYHFSVSTLWQPFARPASVDKLLKFSRGLAIRIPLLIQSSIQYSTRSFVRHLNEF